MARKNQSAIDLRTRLGLAIKRERSALGISQGELAHRSGLHRTYVSDLERGERNPSVGSILKIADALHVTVAELLQVRDSRKG
jgi:transcriptional regulator with XRE-family HTH domain